MRDSDEQSDDAGAAEILRDIPVDAPSAEPSGAPEAPEASLAHERVAPETSDAAQAADPPDWFRDLPVDALSPELSAGPETLATSLADERVAPEASEAASPAGALDWFRDLPVDAPPAEPSGAPEAPETSLLDERIAPIASVSAAASLTGPYGRSGGLTVIGPARDLAPPAALEAPSAPAEIERPRRRGFALRRAIVMGLGGIAAIVAAAVLSVFFYRIVDPPVTITMIIRAAAGDLVQRQPVPLSEISPYLVRAVIAAEDQRFCSHSGFDGAAIRAALADRRAGVASRGASTISQQTAKNAWLWTGGGWPRKAVEAVFTVAIEAAWPKDRIMEVYLNAAEWGDGLFGAEAAAQARFGKSAADLTPREAALMAAVLPSPNRYRLDPPGEYVASRAATLEARMQIVERDGLAGCVLR